MNARGNSVHDRNCCRAAEAWALLLPLTRDGHASRRGRALGLANGSTADRAPRRHAQAAEDARPVKDVVAKDDLRGISSRQRLVADRALRVRQRHRGSLDDQVSVILLIRGLGAANSCILPWNRHQHAWHEDRRSQVLGGVIADNLAVVKGLVGQGRSIRDADRIQLDVGCSKVIRVRKAVRSAMERRLVVEGSIPDDLVMPSAREGSANVEGQSSLEGHLQSLEELTPIVVIWQVRASRRPWISSVGVLVVLREGGAGRSG